jgi:hypothetical protein
MNHGQLELTKLTTTHIQMAFCPRSFEIAKVRTLATLGPHNFAKRPLIEMRFKAKL